MEKLKTLTGKETKDDLFEMKLYMEIDEDIEKRIDISSEAYMNKDFIDMVSEYFKDLNPRFLIKINHNKNRGCVFNIDETNILNENSKFLKEKGISTSLLDENINYSYNLDEVIRANSRIDKWVDQINSAKVDGESLSNLEKFLYIYNILADYSYRHEDQEKEAYVKSRSVVNVLNDDKIVCVGFANLLVTVCNKLNIPCVNQDFRLEDGSGGHSICNVYIKDDKYGIDGIYCSDPTARNNLNAIMRHSDINELYKQTKSGYDQDINFLITNSDTNVNNDMGDLLKKCSDKTKQENEEYFKFYEREDILKDTYTKSKNYVSSAFVEKYISNSYATKEKKLNIIQENKDELVRTLGIVDNELIYEKIEQAIISALEESSVEDNQDIFKLIRKNISSTGLYGVREKDDKICNIKSDYVPIETINEALTQIYKTSSKTRENAEVYAKYKIDIKVFNGTIIEELEDYLNEKPDNKPINDIKNNYRRIESEMKLANPQEKEKIREDFDKYKTHKEKKFQNELKNDNVKEFQNEQEEEDLFTL